MNFARMSVRIVVDMNLSIVVRTPRADGAGGA